MRSKKRIKREIEALREYIDISSEETADRRIAYAMETALCWVLSKDSMWENLVAEAEANARILEEHWGKHAGTQ